MCKNCNGCCPKCELCGNCPCHCECEKVRVKLTDEFIKSIEELGRLEEFKKDFNMQDINDILELVITINQYNDLSYGLLKGDTVINVYSGCANIVED